MLIMSFEEFLENGKSEMSVIIQRVADRYKKKYKNTLKRDDDNAFDTFVKLLKADSVDNAQDMAIAMRFMHITFDFDKISKRRKQWQRISIMKKDTKNT